MMMMTSTMTMTMTAASGVFIPICLHGFIMVIDRDRKRPMDSCVSRIRHGESPFFAPANSFSRCCLIPLLVINRSLKRETRLQGSRKSLGKPVAAVFVFLSYSLHAYMIISTLSVILYNVEETSQ